MSYRDNEVYIYILANEGWGEDLYRFGYIRINKHTSSESKRELLYYLRKIHNDYHPYPFKYIKLYKLRMNKYYRLSLNIQILSDIAKEFITVEDIEKIYNYELPLLRQINNLIIDNGSGCNFINQEGVGIIDRIIKEEFPILQINIIKNYSQEEIDTINRNYKPYKRIKSIFNYFDNRNLVSSYHKVSKVIKVKVSNEIIKKALFNYEDFHSLDMGVATISDLINSSAGIKGWSIPFRLEDSDKDSDILGTNEIETEINLQMYIQ